MARRETKYDKALQAVIATFNERIQAHPIERERGQLTVEAIYLLISLAVEHAPEPVVTTIMERFMDSMRDGALARPGGAAKDMMLATIAEEALQDAGDANNDTLH
jgi:hypothetical protein